MKLYYFQSIQKMTNRIFLNMKLLRLFNVIILNMELGFFKNHVNPANHVNPVKKTESVISPTT